MQLNTGILADDGIRFWADEEGDGPAMVLCHGGPGLWDYLKPVSKLFRDRFQVIRYDQRGGGRSGGQDGPFTIQRFVRDLDSVRASIGSDSWVVAGHSWGASLGLYYALAYPDRVRALLYLSGTGLEWDKWKHLHSLEAQRKRLGPYGSRHDELREKRASRTAEEEREFNVLHWATDYADLADGIVQATKMADAGFRVNLECNALLNREVGRLNSEDLERQCSTLPVPVLVIHGDRDPRPNQAVDSLVESLPRVMRVVLSGAAHFPWHERPDEFQRVVNTWLDGRPLVG